MVHLSRDEVPAYLRDGFFFDSLDVDDEEIFEIPGSCCKLGTSVASRADITFLLVSHRFWGVNRLPFEAVFYLYLHGARKRLCAELAGEFPEHQEVLRKIENETEEQLTIARAIRLGCGVDGIRALYLQGHVLSAEDCAAAASVNDVRALMFLRTHNCPWDHTTVGAAVQHGSIACLEYALANKCTPQGEWMHHAITHEQVESMRCLLRNGEHTTAHNILLAQNLRNVDVLYFLHQQGHNLPAFTCELCAGEGRVDVLEYLHAQGRHWNESTCVAAARAGSLECLIYAHTHGCPWNANTTANAAMGGQLECLRYALDNGCPVAVDPLNVLLAEKYECATLLVCRRYRLNDFLGECICIAEQGVLEGLQYWIVVTPYTKMRSWGTFLYSIAVILVIYAFFLLLCVLEVLVFVLLWPYRVYVNIYANYRAWLMFMVEPLVLIVVLVFLQVATAVRAVAQSAL